MTLSEDGSAQHALQALAAGALAGPAAEAWALFERAWPLIAARVGAFVRAAGANAENRDDRGQAALLRIWSFRGSYRGTSPDALLAWMYRICRNETLRAGEREARAPRQESALAPACVEEPGLSLSEREGERAGDLTGRALDARELERALEQCLDALEGEERAVVELLYSSAAPTEREVAALLELSKSHVHTQRHAALDQLRRCLAGRGFREPA